MIRPILSLVAIAALACSALGDEVKDRWLTATVRLMISHGSGTVYGSGTVVERNGRRGIVATCAHLFRKTEGQQPVHADVYLNGQRYRSTGKCLIYDFKTDVAYVGFDDLPDMPAISMASYDHLPRPGDSGYVAGCDYSSAPAVWDTKITAINRVSTTPNIETSQVPRQGRSGGGVFSADGRLMGVCQGVNPVHGEGIYPAVEHFRPLERAAVEWMRRPARDQPREPERIVERPRSTDWWNPEWSKQIKPGRLSLSQ